MNRSQSNRYLPTQYIPSDSLRAAELDYHILLQVEDPPGSDNWISAPNGIIRQTGESGHYRISYSFSATALGQFNDMILLIKFFEEFKNITKISDVAIPVGATFSSASTDYGFALQINLGSNLPPGQSVIIDFFATSSVNTGGPNDYLITSDATISGNFFDQTESTTTPFTLTTEGPTWTVKAENVHSYKKDIISNGDVSLPDDQAYLVVFTITDSYKGLLGNEGIGGWGVNRARTIDTSHHTRGYPRGGLI